jgi:hypothetical protein
MCKTSFTITIWKTRPLVYCLVFLVLNIAAVTLLSSIAAAQLPGVTPTSQPVGGCAIDGDLLARTPTTSPFSSSNGDFLENPSASGTGGGVFTNPGGLPIDPTTAFHIVDEYDLSDQTIFTQGSKFNDDPNTWHWTTGAPTGKDDVNNALFHFATDPEGHTWFMGGGDRQSINGTSYLDFELLQNTLLKNSDGTFTSYGPDGGRTIGDIAVTVEYSNGGGNAQIVAYQWRQISPGVFSYVIFTPAAGTTFAASNISGPTPVPFGAFGSTTYQQYAYAEAAFDINELVPGLNTCIGARTVLIKTKASDALTAALKDFVEPVQLELGSIPTVHVNSSTICIGQSVTLNATVTFGVGPFAYIWSPGGQTTASITVSPSVTTSYSVKVTGESGCQSLPDTGVVTVNPGPVCSISGADGPVCPSSSNTFTAPAGMNSYLWTISGAADIVGANNAQSVSVHARADCNSSFVLTLAITNGFGCSSTCNKTVQVKDDAAPLLTGTFPPNITGVNSCLSNAPAGPGNAAIAALYTDGCGGGITVTHSVSSSGTDCSWSVVYIYTIKDNCNNVVTPAPTFTVSGGDLTAPVLTGTFPANISGVNSCLASAPAGPGDAAIAALYTDACDGTISVTHTTIPSGTDCSWSILYTYTVKDKCNNTVTPSPTFTVSGADLTAPVLTGVWPSNVTGVNSCLANAPAGPTDAAIAALYTDACGGTISVTHTTVPSGTDCSWSVVYTYTIKDKCNNMVTPSPTFTVSGGDHTAPVLTGIWPSNISSINNCLANAPAGPTDAAIAALYNDACGGTISVTHTTVPSGTDCSWSVVYTYTIKDKCNNTVTPSPTFTVSGADLTAPLLTGVWPSNIAGVNGCLANAPAGPGDATIASLYTDACGGTISVTHTTVPSGTDCGWSILYTYTIKDKCNNTVLPAPTFGVSGGDLTAPVLSGVPNNVTVKCASLVPAPANVTALDNCAGPIVVNVNDVISNQTCDNRFTITRTFSAVDPCGNTTSAPQIITVFDDMAPVLSGVPGDIQKDCTTPLPPPAVVTATDNCGPVNVTFTSITSDSTCPSNFIVTRTWTATDACGNTASGTQVITTGNPVLLAPTQVADTSAILYLINLPPRVINVSCGTQPTITPPGVVEKCIGGVAVLDCWRSDNLACGSPFTQPSTDVYFQAHDGCGHITAIDTVTVNLGTSFSCLIGSPSCSNIFNYSTGNTLSIDPSINVANIVSFSWTVTGSGGWQITAGANGPTITFTAGTGTGHFTLSIVDIYGCAATCTKDVTVQIADEYCTVTQGYWGNPGGNFCNTGNKVTYINTLLGSTGLLVGCASNTLYFAPGEAQCIINLLPGGGTPARITGVNTCAYHPGIQIKNGRINNVLLAQTITLGLNMRVKTNLGSLVLDSPVLLIANSSGCLGGPGIDHPVGCPTSNSSFPVSVFNLLVSKYGPAPTIANLFDLANQALGNCGGIASSMLSPINSAVSLINESFDGCKWATFQGNQSLTNPISTVGGNLDSDSEAAQMDMKAMPNPFVNSTVLECSVSKTTRGTVEVYNLVGTKIATLVDQIFTGGEKYTYAYNPTREVAGVYICLFRTEYGSKVTKLIMSH